MSQIQTLIYKLEEGPWAKFINYFALLLIFAAIALAYNLNCYKNFYTEEAMDSAQLARNISQKKGFTTEYIRPFSIYLLQKNRADHDPMLKQGHPDLANAPVYPLTLAALMKVAPMKFNIQDTQQSKFTTHQPEMMIAVFNQILFFIAVLLVYRLGTILFERSVGIISAIVLATTDLFWKFSASGLPTMLLILIFLCLAWCLVRLLQLQEPESQITPKTWLFAALAGVFIGIGCLTRYSFGWLIIPVVIFLGLFMGTQRLKTSLVTLTCFVLLVSPWLARNYKISGTLFGTAGYAVYHQMPGLFEDKLDRSLNPGAELQKIGVSDFARKFMTNARAVLQNEIPKFGGSWVSGLFLAGLLFPFNSTVLSRLRIFTLLALATFFITQALGFTNIASKTMPEISSENFLVIVAPLVFIYGIALFSISLGQLTLPFPQMRYMLNAIFIIIVSLPLIFTFLPPKTMPISYPPYYPPVFREASGWMNEDELLMSDVPWAVAWYGDRQCSSLTLDYAGPQFFHMNDDLKTVSAIFLTSETIDDRFLTEMVREQGGWGEFALQVLIRREVPNKFPLRKAPLGFAPNQIFLTDWERWKTHPESSGR